MKLKNILVLVSLLKITCFYAQISPTLPTVTYPHPSASGLLSLASNPVDYHTGVPDIRIGLAQLETYSDKIGVNLSLVYHTSGLSLKNKVGDNGMGWNLSAGGTISKIVHNDPDYRNNPHLVYTTDDDIFVYNFMGYSGQFRIKKISQGTYGIDYLTPTTLRIEFVMNSNGSSATGVTFDEVDYFTIYDDYGNLYKFDVFDEKMATFNLNLITPESYIPVEGVPAPLGPLPISAKYRSSYHLSVVKNTNNISLLTFDYEDYSISVNPGSPTSAVEIENKLVSIISPGHGTIEFDYTFYPNAPRQYLDNPNSYFKLNSLQLKNYSTTLIKKFEFVYNTFSVNYNYELGTTTNLSRRILTEVKEYNNDLSSSVSTFLYYNHPSNNATPNSNCSDFDFGRDQYGYLNLKNKIYPVIESSYPDDTIPEFGVFYTEPSLVTTGALSKIVYPTGGSILYEFESNTYSESVHDALYTPEEIYFKNIPAPTPFENNPFNETIDVFNSFVFNTAVTNSFNFTVSGTSPKSFYFQFDHVPFYSQIHVEPYEALIPNYTLTGPNGFTYDFGVLAATTGVDTYFPCVGKRVELAPGNYTIHINTYYSDASTTGQIFINEKTPNYPLQEYFYGGGLRIKKIGLFKSAVANFFNGNTDDLVDYKEFVYTEFNNPNRSSCDISIPYSTYPNFYNYTDDFLTSFRYHNVKVLYGKNQELGYEKFTYLKFTELPLNPTSNKLYRNLFYQFKNGFLKKHEVFSTTHLKLKEIENSYSYLIDPNFFTWIYPAAQYKKDYYYPNGGTTPGIKQTNQLFTYNSLNKKISESTLVNSLGESLITKNFYHTGNTVYSKNRISEIERIETYKGTELLSKTQINYATNWTNNVSYLPQTILSSKGTNSLETRIRYNKYDAVGNPLEMQQEGGTVISYIWGYNKSFPIAKIENASNTQIQAALSISDITTLTEANLSLINGLRTSLPNAMVTTFTYKPLIGVETVTDPQGIITYFTYDSFGRLKNSKDTEQNLIKAYEYVYQNQSQNQNYVKSIHYKKPSTLSTINLGQPTDALVGMTFFDGLGRPIQQVAHKQGSNNGDIITPIAYDSYGRQVKDYLPYVRASASLDYDSLAFNNVAAFYATNNVQNTGNPNFATTGYPYSQKELEASPLSRVFKQAAPGDVWRLGAGKEIKFDYQTNTATEVFLFKAQTTWNAGLKQYDIQLIKNNKYATNELYKTITKDENWVSGLNNTTEEFKNKSGQLVLKRTYNEGQAHDTYYVYDDYGNLSYVLPPLVNVSGTVSAQHLSDFCYQYKYDARNRLIEKKLPGKIAEYIVYDKLDRPVLTGPAYNPFTGSGWGWLVSKYDALGRVVYTGWMSETTMNATKRYQLQNTADTFSGPVFETKTTAAGTIDGISVFYTNDAYPKTNLKILTVSYFDNYVYTNAPNVPANVEGQDVMTNVKGMPTGSWVRILTGVSQTQGELSYAFYDKQSRPILSHTKNHQGGYTENLVHYNFDGTTQYSITNHKLNTNSTVVSFQEGFEYTPQGRLLTHQHYIPGQQVELLAHNTYDNLGQLITKDVGGYDVSSFTGLQKVNYIYNIRGWLTDINNVSDLSQNGGLFNDLFSFKINYNTVDNSVNGEVKELFNGNISETYWRTANDNTLRKYGYKYDQLNRLNDAYYQRPGGSDPDPGNYNEHLTYDKNGNILTLHRNGEHDDLVTPLEIDNLEYGYIGNQLQKVIDYTNNPNGFKDDSDGINDEEEDYWYDGFGNMTHDQNKGIQEITYNHLNLPLTIDFGEGKIIHYIYTAQGKKVSKLVEAVSIHQTTLYDNGFQYVDGVLQFFPHAEGYVRVTEGIVYNYVYNYTDHLGNIRLSYGLDPRTEEITILEENHYYPFGLKHKNYNMDLRDYERYLEEQIHIGEILIGDAVYKYKYNGKEWQDELGLNFYDYGARNYDPAIGRWMNMDRLAETFESITPYQYAGNTPTFYIDVNGDYIYINDHTQDGKQYRYQNGETQHQVDGKWVAIDSSVKLSAFVLHTIAGLHHLALSGKTGADLINVFSGTERSVEFNYESGRNEAINGENGGNDLIYIDHFKRPMVFTNAGSKAQMSGLYLVIGHEMSHLTDPNRFMDVVWYGKVATSEIRATHVENMIRAESGQPLRTHYGAIKDKTGNLHPHNRSLLIDKAGNSLYYNREGKRYSSRGVKSYKQAEATIQDINRVIGGGILLGRFNYNDLRK